MKEKRMKGTPESRRRKALRRSAAFLLTAAVLQITGLYGFFPTAGLRYGEESVNCGRTKVVAWRGGDAWNRLLLCGANDNALLIGESVFTCAGWMDGGVSAADCSAPGPFHAVISFAGGGMAAERRIDCRFLAFGRVDDPDIQTVEIRFRVRTGVQDGAPLYEDRYTFTSDRREWIQKDGRAYFLLERQPMPWDTGEAALVLTTAYDGEGKVVAASEGFQTDWREQGENVNFL